MKKIITTLVLGVILGLFTNGAQAQEDKKSMKSLMVDSLSEYGRQLYNRGNYAEAANVYARILTVDQDNEKAMNYLKAIKAKGYPVKEAVLAQISIAKQKTIVIEKKAKAEPVKVSAPAVAVKPMKVIEAKAVKAPVVEVADIKGPVTMPVVQDNLDADLAELQKDLNALRQSLHAKTQQIQTLEKQLPSL